MAQPTPVRFKLVFDLLFWIPHVIVTIILFLGVFIWNTEPGVFPEDQGSITSTFWMAMVAVFSFWVFSDDLRDEIRKGKQLTTRVTISFLGASLCYGLCFVVKTIDMQILPFLVFEDSSPWIKAFDFLIIYFIRIMFVADILAFGLYLYSIRHPREVEKQEERCSC